MKQFNRSSNDSSYQYTQPLVSRPTAPAIGRQNTNTWKKADPSSAAFTERYPRPSFFDYRTAAKGFDGI
jgi:hypothetical protein